MVWVRIVKKNLMKNNHPLPAPPQQKKVIQSDEHHITLPTVR